MTSADLPKVNTLVTVALDSGAEGRSRVESSGDARLTVTAPAELDVDDLTVGRTATVRWSAGRRGCHTAPMRVTARRGRSVPTWDLDLAGPVKLEQQRRFVRGGGGEPLALWHRLRPQGMPFDGVVLNVSEGGVRARFTEIVVSVGDRVTIQFQLADEWIEVPGRVVRIRAVPHLGATELVVLYEAAEQQATAIRRYIFQRESLIRRAALR